VISKAQAKVAHATWVRAPRPARYQPPSPVICPATRYFQELDKEKRNNKTRWDKGKCQGGDMMRLLLNDIGGWHSCDEVYLNGEGSAHTESVRWH
jgi:hypothetical protein